MRRTPRPQWVAQEERAQPSAPPGARAAPEHPQERAVPRDSAATRAAAPEPARTPAPLRAERRPARKIRSASNDSAAADRFSARQKRTVVARRVGTWVPARRASSKTSRRVCRILACGQLPNAWRHLRAARVRLTVPASIRARSVRASAVNSWSDDRSRATALSETAEVRHAPFSSATDNRPAPMPSRHRRNSTYIRSRLPRPY